MNVIRATVAVSIYVITHMEVIIAHVKRDMYVPIWMLNIVMIMMNVPLEYQIVTCVETSLEGKLRENGGWVEFCSSPKILTWYCKSYEVN